MAKYQHHKPSQWWYLDFMWLDFKKQKNQTHFQNVPFTVTIKHNLLSSHGVKFPSDLNQTSALLFPFIVLMPCVQANLHKWDGLITIFLALLINDIYVFLVLYEAGVHACDARVATWSRPNLHSFILPRLTVVQRPT